MPPVRRRRTTEEILAEEEDDLRVDVDPVSRLPTVANIHKILTNRFYTGKILGNDGIWVPSSHEAIIPEQLFNGVQARLRARNKSARYADLLDHPMRGIIRCGICRRLYTPYQKKGIIYYGARCSNQCFNPTKSFNFDFIAKGVGELIEKLSFTDDERSEIDARASTDIALLDTKRLNQLDENERRKQKLREDLAYLSANKLMLLRTGAYTPEKLVEEETGIHSGLAALCSTEMASDVSMRETVRDVVTLSELLKNAAVIYYSATPQEKDAISRVIFSELTLFGKTVDYKCKNGFAALASRFISVCDPIGWLSELHEQHDLIQMSMSKLKTLILIPT